MATCEHLEANADHQPATEVDGCEECLANGSGWVHLRSCADCGHIGCCDSSPNRHADAHYRTTNHPVIRSAEPGEAWRWCYVDELMAT